jgi:hypothetical protein
MPAADLASTADINRKPVSQARSDAARRNGGLSKGPVSIEGKEKSRRNSLKHGLSGSGVVVAADDAAEVEQRTAEFTRDLAPQSSVGQFLTRQMATLSVRMDRLAKQETKAVANRVRHAIEEFDRERSNEADRLLGVLGEDPKRHLRALKSTPEGVVVLIEAWEALRSLLTREDKPYWVAWHLDRAENLTGNRIDDFPGSEFALLSNAFWGEKLKPGKVDDAQKNAARLKLIEQIDAQIAELEAHYQTLDFETLEIDRAEAPDRALFDASPEAILARRYESEASRRFFKSMEKLKKVEAEVAARPETSGSPPPPRSYAPLGSFGAGNAQLQAKFFEHLERELAEAEATHYPTVSGLETDEMTAPRTA